jgi:hypothetical protein
VSAMCDNPPAPSQNFDIMHETHPPTHLRTHLQHIQYKGMPIQAFPPTCHALGDGTRAHEEDGGSVTVRVATRFKERPRVWSQTQTQAQEELLIELLVLVATTRSSEGREIVKCMNMSRGVWLHSQLQQVGWVHAAVSAVCESVFRKHDRDEKIVNVEGCRVWTSEGASGKCRKCV